MTELPHTLIVEISKYTQTPWWNGKAYDDYHGLSATIRAQHYSAIMAIDDLAQQIEVLREDKMFDLSDRLRTIAGRLARSLRSPLESEGDLLWVIARGWK